MEPGAPEKRTVRLSIYNHTFSLLVSGDGHELIDAANHVDELMSSIAKAGNMDSTRVAILACLHLQDQMQNLERELNHLKGRIEDRSRQLAKLLDDVVEGGPQS